MSLERNKQVALDFIKASGLHVGFRDGRICMVKEYLDTYHAAEVFAPQSPLAERIWTRRYEALRRGLA